MLSPKSPQDKFEAQLFGPAGSPRSPPQRNIATIRMQIPFLFIRGNSHEEIKEDVFRSHNPAFQIGGDIVPNCRTDIHMTPSSASAPEEYQFFIGNNVAITCSVLIHVVINLIYDVLGLP